MTALSIVHKIQFYAVIIMPVDHLTLYLNESTGLTGPALDRCKKYETNKRMDHFYFGGPIRGFQDTVYLGKN